MLRCQGGGTRTRKCPWIPLDQPYEHLLIDALVRQERRFLKPLRFESKQGAAFPNAVLLDTGDAGTLESHPPRLVHQRQTTRAAHRSLRCGVQHELPAVQVDRHRRFDPRKAASTLLTYQRDRTLAASRL